MPDWSHQLYAVTAAVRRADTHWRLWRQRSAAGAQRRVWRQLVAQLGRTRFWAGHGLEPGVSYDQFRERVPLHLPEDLAPAVQRMQQGEADVLWPGTCRTFARTAGLETGIPRILPVTGPLQEHFRRAGADAVALHGIRTGEADAAGGHGVLCIEPVEPGVRSEAAFAFPGWLAEAGRAPGRRWDWFDGSTPATPGAEAATVLAGMPPRLIQFARSCGANTLSGGSRAPYARAPWPALRGLVLGGMPAGPFVDELRSLFGPAVAWHEVYSATEAIIAAQDGEPGQGLRVLADRGVFFEFLPMTEFDSAPVAQLGGRTVPLADVKTGLDYAVVLTTPGGLARYVLGDVVRFVSREPARLLYIGRTTLRLHAAGENVSELELTDALTRLCRRRGWNTVTFHVAPLAAADTGTPPHAPRHEWWIELRPGTMETPLGPAMAAELDTDLQRANPTYARARRSAALGPPVVRLVMPGIFEYWLRSTGRWDGHQKFARCRPDRQIADALASLTQFARD